MVESTNYQMAIDLLCCHLGLTEDEAKEQLGISEAHKIQQQIANVQPSLMSIPTDR
ncbi:hypothetical protein MACH09_09660 [Vibrio sp. MACH09]|uniref:hypothetical protein n=1 Tax=unclassified Vibrio TaxID=2614977 RepID=UPI00149351F0|nr:MULTISPECIES: hypothetical protein [unclassified Vibrio]GLO60458.1 hypothetical protein MACH09_09660 [Vibrio sp. MACH09]